MTINTTTDFKGLLTVDQSTGVVSITNAHPAGSYEVTVDAGFGITQTFTLTVGNTLCSQGQFYAPAIPEVAVGTNPYSVAVGDFNGDGKQDIATVNEGSNTVSIRLGDGQGGFSGTTNVAVGSNPQSVAIGDFNGDGNQDIAVANRISNTVSIRLGDGQGGFSGTTEIAVGLRPFSVAVGDFNGDGKQDIATANYGSDGVSIRLGDGQGGFSGTTDFNVGFRPLSLAIGDFNGDGKQDIATVLSSSSNIVSIHLGDGQGGFSRTTNVTVRSNPVSVAIGDFNGDGKQDIATANYGESSVSIRLGDGLGGFSGTTNVAVGSSPKSVAVGDFNGDGKQDIAATNRGSNSVSIRLGDGQGGFSGTTNVTVGEGVYSSVGYSVAVGDFNGDGNQDIAAVNEGSNTVAIRLGIGDAAEINLTGNGVTIPNGNTSIATADHTDFGNGYNINRTYTIQNAGTGPLTINSIGISGADMALFTISGITLPTIIAAGSEVNFNVNFISTSVGTKTATVTINNDDCDEGSYTFNVEATSIAIILGNYSDPSIAIAGGNVTVSPDAAPTGGASITAYTTTDFRGLLTVDQSTGAVTITNAHPAGTYAVTVDAGFGITKTFTLTVGNTLCSQGQFYVPAIPEVAVESNPLSVAVGDFNGDGNQDIATVNIGSNSVYIRLGDGQGGFSGTTNVAVGSNPQSVAIGDFNGDGKQDIATANRGSSTISIRLGDGQGGFSGTTEVGSRTRPVSVAVGDFNGDGKQDIAAANQASSTVSIRLGDGQGGFSGTTDVAVGSTPRSVAVGDFNGDGNQDIAAANFGSSTVSIRLGDGQGGFSDATEIAVGSSPQSVAIGDFNGDGNQDLATANFNSKSVSIRLGDGQGGFSGVTEIAVGSNPYSVTIGDFNGDGNQDIATANEGSNSVSIRLGDGQGGFSGTTEITVGIAPRSVAVGDFNGDGMQDIAAAINNTAGSVSILLGGFAEINLQGNGIAITSGDNTPDVADDTDFGTVVLNTPSTKTYTVQNTGTSDLIVSAIDISGTDAASFAIGEITLPATIAAGDVATFTVTLTAGTSGVKSATVTISSDDCDEGAYTFSVQGKDDSYTVSFDANGGTGTMADQAIANNASANLTSNSFTRTGYTFAGWATTSGGAVAYADGVSYTMSDAADVMLYAQWTPNNYKVTFDPNDGIGTMTNQFIAYLASANLAANAFTRTGYSFTGWNTAADGSGTSYADGASYTMNDAADVTLFAAWTVNNYTVTFDSNGGSGTMTNQSIAFNAAANLIVNSFTRTGYSFTGWNTVADGSGTGYADEAGYTMSTAAGVTLFATWTANKYTITFDANGSFGEMSDQTIAYEASENLTANAFNLTGYTFAGWATTPTGAVAFADGAIYTMSTTANVTLYARWISTGGGLFIQIFIRQSESMPRYVGGIGTTFTLDVGTSDAIESVKNQISNRITSVPSENLVLRFAGIILEDGRTLADYNIGNESVINLFAVNLYPATSVEVGGTASVLSVAAPGADYTNKTVSTTSDFTGTLSILPSGEVSIENASPAGTYVIQIDNNLVIDNSNFSTPFQEFNLTVNNSSYTVIFNANGGTGTMADQSIDLNASANLTANTFTRTGYTFIGWATTSAGAVVYANGANYTMSDAADVTLYAQWIEVPTISAGGPLTFCAGENVVLTSSSATGNQWYKGGVLIADAINETYTATEIGVYTVKVTTAGVVSEASAGISVTVNSLPTAAITNNTATTVLTCTTTAISVTATGGVSYAWDNGLGNAATASITAPGTYSVTVTNANGCSDTASIEITADVTVPTAGITNDTNATVLTCTTTAISVSATGGVSYAWDNGLGNEATASITTPGTYTVTVTNANGCTATKSIEITADVTAPTAGITNDTNATELTCSTTAISVTATGGVSYAWDNGLGNEATASITTPGTYTVTVTNANGCTATKSIEITADVTAPTAGITNNTATTILTCTTTAISVTATGGTSYSWTGGTTPTTAANSFTSPGTYTVTVTNANGCTDTESIIVTEDKTILTITSADDVNVGNTIGFCSATVAITNATFADNCSGSTLAWGMTGVTTGNGSGQIGTYAFNIGETTITYTVTDASNNTATDVMTVMVTDNENPTITAPIAVNVNTDAGTCTASGVALGTSTTADNCTVASVTNDAPETFPLGATTVTWTVTDGSGNTDTATQTVTVTDNQKPVITTNGDKSANNDLDACGAAVTVSATAADNCSVGEPTGVRSDNLALTAPYPVGSTTITWNVTEINGVAADAVTQTVTVTDNQKPVITTNGDKSVNNDPDACGAAVTVSATAADNCSVGEPTGVRSDALALTAPYPVGITTITWNVTDINGLAGDAVTQTVTVTDNQIPVITCPTPAASYNSDAGLTTKTLSFSATATDNCSVAHIKYHIAGAEIPFPYAFQFGTTTVTATATDVNGRTQSCDFTVNVSNITTQIELVVMSLSQETDIDSFSPEVSQTVSSSQQYSDMVSFSATISPWTTTPQAGGSVSFKVGAELLGTVTNITASGVATLIVPLKEVESILNYSGDNSGNASNGQLKPGIKSVSAEFVSDGSTDPVYLPVTITNPNGLTITKEDAVVLVDNSISYFTVNPTTNKGTVWLRANVEDVNDGEDTRGDIRNATLQFLDGTTGAGSPIGSAKNVGLLDPSVTTIGTAINSFEHTLTNNEISAGGKNWVVWAEANNYYQGYDRRDMNIVTLAVPGSDYVTGGGHYILESSKGLYAGTAGKRMNFGFNMKWNKSGKRLQGQINIIFRRMVDNELRIYQIKSNAVDGLTVSNTNLTEAGVSRSYSTALMTTKANLTDITDPINPFEIGGGLSLRMVVWDNNAQGSEGQRDKVSVELLSSNSQLLFSSYMPASSTQVRTLNGGNINIRNNSPVTVTCGTPTGLQTSSIIQTSAQVSWTPVSGALSYNLQYRVRGGVWTTGITSATNSYSLEGLIAGTTYEWSVQTVCSGGNSGWANANFGTEADCNVPPSGLQTTGIGATTATFSWTPVTGASSYEIQYSLANEISWTTVSPTVSTNSYGLSGLTPGTAYSWRVRNFDCSEIWSNLVTFTTLTPTCLAPQSLGVSNLTNTSATLNWAIVNGSFGYGLQYRVVGSNTWSNTVQVSTNSYTLTGLIAGTDYEWQVQIWCDQMGDLTSVYTAGTNFTTLSSAGCATPTSLQASSITSSGATLSWTAVSGATAYNLQYRIGSNGAWVTLNGATSPRSITGLEAATAYQWTVQAVCNGTPGSWAATMSFTTLSNCTSPTNLAAQPSNISAVFSWDGPTVGATYKLEWKRANHKKWNVISSVTSPYTLEGLTASTKYQWKLTLTCGGTQYVSTVRDFTTTNTTAKVIEETLLEQELSELPEQVSRELSVEVLVYPNPTSSSQVTLSLKGFAVGDVFISIVTPNGVSIVEMTDKVEHTSTSIPLDISSFAKGVYYVYVRQGNIVKAMKVVSN